MNTGTQAAKEAGNMVDLDCNPTKLIEIVEIGKQLLITRGSLTTFSHRQRRRQILRHHPGDVRGDLSGARRAQHHAAAFADSRAILSAVIFNALIIVALMPLALRGVQYRPAGAAGDAAAQPAHLRHRRHHRPVHRHQADRCRARRPCTWCDHDPPTPSPGVVLTLLLWSSRGCLPGTSPPSRSSFPAGQRHPDHPRRASDRAA